MALVTFGQQYAPPPPPYSMPPSGDLPTALSIISNPEGKDFLITFSPPQEPMPNPSDPNKPGSRAPVDIVLVIDVSGSMDAIAPAPGEDEPSNLTVLDVVKHAVRTIVTSMGEGDRVSVVTFSTSAKVVAPLTRADEDGKRRVMDIVERLRTESSTNIWDGLKAGMNVLTSKTNGGNLGLPARHDSASGRNPDQPAALSSQRLSSIFLLTDGQPNIEPPRGHIPMLELYLQSHPPESTKFTINTFGFGYSLDSQLLNDIATVGKGAYGFIPDSGMVGTVFVHAAANTYATFCDSCELSIVLEDRTMVKNMEVLGGLKTEKATWGIEVNLGAVQYGQTKDVVVRIQGGLRRGDLTVTVKYRPWSSPPSRPNVSITRTISARSLSPTSDPNLLYHTHRVTFVQEILALFRSSNTRRSSAPPVFADAAQRLIALAKMIQNDVGMGGLDRPPRSDALALAKDIEGEVIMALNGKADKGAFDKWGRHYLPSLARSHQRQQCGNFKDESLQVYGRDSPLFVKSRNEMDSLFDNLPPPIPAHRTAPSYSAPFGGGGWQGQNAMIFPGLPRAPGASNNQSAFLSMASFHQKAAPCFSGHCHITIASSGAFANVVVRVDELKRGMKLQTPAGPRLVAAIVRTLAVDGKMELCAIGNKGLLITPWHPVKIQDGWEFPVDISPPREVACEAVYSILLEPDQNSEAHSVWIEGVLCVTLGHGVVRSSQDHDNVRAHSFLGDYHKIVTSMAENPGFFEEDGILEAYGTLKSEDSGLVCGFSWKMDEKLGFVVHEANELGFRHVAQV